MLQDLTTPPPQLPPHTHSTEIIDYCNRFGSPCSCSWLVQIAQDCCYCYNIYVMATSNSNNIEKTTRGSIWVRESMCTYRARDDISTCLPVRGGQECAVINDEEARGMRRLHGTWADDEAREQPCGTTTTVFFSSYRKQYQPLVFD